MAASRAARRMALVMANSNSMQAFERQLDSPAWRPGLPPARAAAPAQQEPSAALATRDTFAASAQHPGLLFFYAGPFYAELVQAATQRVRQRLDELDTPQHAKDRLLRVFTELACHLATPGPNAAEPQGRIAVGCLGEHFWVLCSRRLAHEQVSRVRAQLDTLRLLSAEELAELSLCGHRLTTLSGAASASGEQTPEGVESGWLQVASNCSVPIEYGFSSPLPDGGSQLHVRAWI
jgi:hypothetical protein